MTFPVSWLPSDQAAPRWTKTFGPPDSNVGDIAALDGNAVLAGSTGLVADAGHVHNIKFPRVHAYNTATQAIANNTLTAITFAATLWSTPGYNLWSVSNPTRITVPAAGLWLFVCQITWASGAGSFRETTMRINGIGATMTNLVTPNVVGNITNVFAVVSWPLNISDYVEVVAAQDSGGSLNVAAGSFFQSVFLGN